MTRAKVRYIIIALRRTYPQGIPTIVNARTRVRLQGGSSVSLRQYCRLYWYFDVGTYSGIHGRIYDRKNRYGWPAGRI